MKAVKKSAREMVFEQQGKKEAEKRRPTTKRARNANGGRERWKARAKEKRRGAAAGFFRDENLKKKKGVVCVKNIFNIFRLATNLRTKVARARREKGNEVARYDTAIEGSVRRANHSTEIYEREFVRAYGSRLERGW